MVFKNTGEETISYVMIFNTQRMETTLGTLFRGTIRLHATFRTQQNTETMKPRYRVLYRVEPIK